MMTKQENLDFEKLDEALSSIQAKSEKLSSGGKLMLVTRLSEKSQIEALVERANSRYRAGWRVVTDKVYDEVLIPALKLAKPDSEFLKSVEPEPEGVFGKTVELPERMLSTNKAYSIEEISKWCDDVIAAQSKYGFGPQDTFFRITPKLDGFAAYDDGKRLYTRGNGRQGTDITRAIERGLVVRGRRGSGRGEIVVNKSWFEQQLSGKYENSRNVIAAVIKEGEIDEEIKVAIAANAIYFMPFVDMTGWLLDKNSLLLKIEDIWKMVAESSTDTDGLVIEATNEQVKVDMGSTNHHHRWQIAFKKNTEFHDIEVTGIEWQTAKTGRITPVVQLKPTKVSGVTISRATGHHYGNVAKNAIDWGAVVRVCRSGLVIPYIESVVKPASHFSAPGYCPSCGEPTKVDGDNLLCTNEVDCPAQIGRTLEFFFKTIGNCDGFGPSVIEKLCSNGISKVSDIYSLDMEEFVTTSVKAEISGGVTSNLYIALSDSRKIEIEDWRFLAAFSIHNVGKGGCERLLKHHRIEDVFDLTVDDIVQIDGFAEKTANSLVKSLAKVKSQVTYLLPKFNLKRTTGSSAQSSPITGKTVVFTGSMQKGNRGDMEKQAKELGAKVSGSVSSKTDYLICGENVGASKTDAAKKHNVKVLTEDEYLKLIGA
jgi:DNA ligase (NAD+)